jgi:hypothetical protein
MKFLYCNKLIKENQTIMMVSAPTKEIGLNNKN